MKVQNRDEEIINAIKKNKGIRIRDLAKSLGMWDSNLRKKLNVLVSENQVERFIENKYTCVRLKKWWKKN